MEENTDTLSSEAQTVSAKYVFLDVVRFTQGRTVEAQTEIIGALNNIVRTSLEKNQLSKEATILLPTGDGICICLLNIDHPYDMHITLALNILAGVHARNGEAEDTMRQFQVRIGINANIDNIVTDVNGRKNVAGAGINLAQRIMSQGDGGHVLVGQSVFEILQHREKYAGSFQEFKSVTKHGNAMHVYQYRDGNHVGLNMDTPTGFSKQSERKLTEFAAYFVAHVMVNRDLFLNYLNVTGAVYASVVLLYFRVTDAIGLAHANETLPHGLETPEEAQGDMKRGLDFFLSLPFWVRCKSSRVILDNYLAWYYDCFESGLGVVRIPFVTEKGKLKLKAEWPDIWAAFDLDTQSQAQDNAG